MVRGGPSIGNFFLIMNFKEESLENIIWQNAQSEKGRTQLLDRGLIVSEYVKRQIDLGCYGRLDLLDVYYNEETDRIVLDVIELKKEFITIDALMQAARYVTGIKEHIQELNLDIDIEITLVGENIDLKTNFVYLLNYLSNVRIITYNYSIDGIRFTQHENNWRLDKQNPINIESTGIIKSLIKQGESLKEDFIKKIKDGKKQI